MKKKEITVIDPTDIVLLPMLVLMGLEIIHLN